MKDKTKTRNAEDGDTKQTMLTQGTPSGTSSIADAVVVKNEDLFFVCQPDSRVPLEDGHGFGLYYHDCRFLNGYELKLAGRSPVRLVSSAEAGFMAVFQLTNPALRLPNGQRLEENCLGIKWRRVADDASLSLQERITFQNFQEQSVRLPVTLSFTAEFDDIFAVRGLLGKKTGGRMLNPAWKENRLCFSYAGSDGLYRTLTVSFSERPASVQETTAQFEIALEPRGQYALTVSLDLGESAEKEGGPRFGSRLDLPGIEAVLQRSSEEWLQRYARVHSDSILLNQVLERALLDLRALRTRLDDCEFFAAGVPWFVTLFGRDSLLTALQILAFNPVMAEQSLRLTAKYQGTKEDEWRDEQPGKILHELRVGELARKGEIPHTPYYGTVDATPLFLILLRRYVDWTGNLGLFEELRGNVERALFWIDRYGDADGDGFVEYESKSGQGLVNQGWKDSGNAIIQEDGGLARPPISLVEVQAYVFLAKKGLADLFERVGESKTAARLREEAEKLQSRFNDRFWIERKAFYALALQADKEPAAVISSNPGHALWAGIAEAEKARRTVERLMAPDMFNGWGVRTISSSERGYNPVGYHLGTVWPHDNAIIAAGCRRYGFDEAADRIFNGLVQAAMRFEHYRLPEVFSGFPREEYKVPVHYPVACHPQAWAAGSVPFLIEILLGLEPEALDNRLRVVRPRQPEFVRQLEISGLRLGPATLDLQFQRGASGAVEVEISRQEGEVELMVERS